MKNDSFNPTLRKLAVDDCLPSESLPYLSSESKAGIEPLASASETARRRERWTPEATGCDVSILSIAAEPGGEEVATKLEAAE